MRMITVCRRVVGVWLLLLLPALTFGQSLPSEVVQALNEECSKYRGPVNDDAVFGDVLNAVAWRTRHLGIGLSRKTGGRHIDSPVGPVAEDILQDCNTGHHWDVFAAAAVGNPLVCGAGPSIGIMRDPNRPCVPPVEPRYSGTPTPLPIPRPIPPPVYVPPPAPVLDTFQVELLAAQVLALRSELEAHRLEARDGKDSLYQLIAEVLIAEHVGSLYERLAALQQAVERRR